MQRTYQCAVCDESQVVSLISLYTTTKDEIFQQIGICLPLSLPANICPLHLWLDSFRCATWLIQACDMTHVIFDMTFHTCDMIYSYAWYDPLNCVTWRIVIYDMTRWHVLPDRIICVTWRIDMCDIPHWHIWQDSFAGVEWCIDICVTWCIDVYDVNH